jgi:carboxypeptidase family protein
MVESAKPKIGKGRSTKTGTLGSVLSVLFCVPVFCQTSGEITGEVKDSGGAVIVEAKVVVTNAATSAVRETTTTGAGVYSFPSLQPGFYNVRVE